MSKINFWNSVAKGAVKGWDMGREWDRQNAEEARKKDKGEYEKEQRSLAKKLLTAGFLDPKLRVEYVKNIDLMLERQHEFWDPQKTKKRGVDCEKVEEIALKLDD